MRSLSLRSHLLGFFLLGILYILGGAAFLALGTSRASREALEGTERLARELEARGRRADSLAGAVNVRDGMPQAGSEPISPGTIDPWVESAEDLALEALQATRRLLTLTILWALSTAFLALAALVWFHVRVRAPLRALEEGAEAQTRVTRSLMERVGRLMEDSAREIYIFHGVDLHLVQMNGTLLRSLQWGENPYDEATPFDFILTPERDELRRDLDRLRTGEISLLRFSVRHRRRDGTAYPVEGNFQYSGDEEPPVFVAVARDMTEIYEREDQLRQAMRLQAVGQLTGGVAHDFNNLLTVIQGGLELIREDMSPGDPDLPLAEEALAAAERGAALTHQLLAFSRSQALRPRVLDMNELLGETERMLRRTLGEDVDVELVRSPELWRCQADPAEVKNVVLNLALNARDAMPLGGKITIETANSRLDEVYAATVEELQAGQYVMLAVRDTGKGMSPEVLARAFEPFFTTKGVGQGSGLGLSMAFGFAKQSRGHIMLESEVGKGTTARLYLPRVRAEQMELEGMEPSLSDCPAGAGERSLVLEKPYRVEQLARRVREVIGDEDGS